MRKVYLIIREVKFFATRLWTTNITNVNPFFFLDKLKQVYWKSINNN